MEEPNETVPLFKMVCPECGEVFYTADGRIKFCSKKCRVANRKKYIRDYHKKRYNEDELFRQRRIRSSAKSREKAKNKNASAL